MIYLNKRRIKYFENIKTTDHLNLIFPLMILYSSNSKEMNLDNSFVSPCLKNKNFINKSLDIDKYDFLIISKVLILQ